jgi:two-component system, sensor histidine kinase
MSFGILGRDSSVSIRTKLIAIFLIIKVIPLVILAWLSWQGAELLGGRVAEETVKAAGEMRKSVKEVGERTTEDAIRALDLQSRENVERMSMETANAIASFLYERDGDILTASQLDPSEAAYQRFFSIRKRQVLDHESWVLTRNGDGWTPLSQSGETNLIVDPSVEDNRKDWHSNPPDNRGRRVTHPLYHEMTFVDPNGMELIKVTMGGLTSDTCRDVSQKENTYCKAETYFQELRRLKPGEIFVSKVIGPYVGSNVNGLFTPETAGDLGVPFEPEKAGYAGKENPVGRRFNGLIRWATAVERNGVIIGYVTLALDHKHIMEFTDHLVPGEERVSPITDASNGNYAFIMDYEGVVIAHPRHFYIVGYDPETGELCPTWLDKELFDKWKKSGKTFSEFIKLEPHYQDPSLSKKPDPEQAKLGQLGIDGRYLNFAPQCLGFHTLTEHGGSGSFAIFWSGLWKLNSTAVIPYFTGQYGSSPRGFGYVGITAKIEDFHKPALVTKQAIDKFIVKRDEEMSEQQDSIERMIADIVVNNLKRLTLYTGTMVVAVIIVAVWMASVLTGRISIMVKAIQRFREGDLKSRLHIRSRDEMGELAESFNRMAQQLETLFTDLETKNLELEKARDQLESRVNQRTAELAESNSRFREAKEKAEVANRAKSVFLANISHEIRTPMNAILGFAQVIQRESGLSPQQVMHREAISRNGEHLLTLINDVLEMSKIEAGRATLNSATFDLNGLLYDLESMFRVRINAKGLQLMVEKPPDVPRYLVTDEAKLRQVLINLLSNAVKFTDEGCITLRVFHTTGQVTVDEKTGPDSKSDICGSHDTNLIYFEIEDTGRGIAKGEMDRLFKYFEQTSSGLEAQTGTGLGLAISREYVRLMGGEMEVASQVGVRTVFRFHIPVKAGLSKGNLFKGASLSVVGLKTYEHEYRLLVAEDERDSRYLLKQILERIGYTVREANNGAEAIAVIQEWKPHLVLMDGAMPVMDGLEATRRIKKEFHDIPVIMVTANALEEDRGKMLAAGADDVIRKPYREYDLLGSIKAQLGLEYVYCEEDTLGNPSDESSSPIFPPAAFSALPSDLVEKMKEATINGYLDRLRRLLDKVENYDTKLADGLRILVDRYEYDTLCRLFSGESN